MFLYKMVSITLSVPEQIKELMNQFPEVNWSGLVRQAISEKAKKLALKRELFSQLENEREFSDWAVNLVREGRNKGV